MVEVGNLFLDRGYSFDQNVYFLRSWVHFSRLRFLGSGGSFFRQSHFLKISPSYIFAGALSLDHGAHFQDLGSGTFDWPPYIFPRSPFTFAESFLLNQKSSSTPLLNQPLKNLKTNIKVQAQAQDQPQPLKKLKLGAHFLKLLGNTF